MKRITPVFLLAALTAFGQFTLPNAVPLPNARTQVLDHLGRACSGCLLWTYAAGTSTPQVTYTDSTGSTPNTNPIVLDTAGAANIWIGALSYKLTLERPPIVSGHGVPLWTVDNVSDVTFNYIAYLKTITDSALLSYRNPLNGAVDRTVRDKLAESVSVKDFGAKGDGVTDDTTAIQAALNLVGAHRIVFPAGTYLISATLWVHSNTAIAGEGGRAKVTTIKRKDGMYTDAIVAGIWDGANHPRSVYSLWMGGYPYNSTTNGANISITSLYIDGNGANAGQPPAEPSPPLASYRGSNIWIQWTSGVLVDDVYSEHASNDNCFIASCRRVTVVNSWFRANNLINPSGFDTRNGLTIAGTMAATDGDPNDMLICANNIAEANQDLGIAIQARNMYGGSATFGGAIVVSGNISRANNSHGIAVEAFNNGGDSSPVRSVVFSNNISAGDGTSGTAYGLLVSYQAYDINVIGNVVRNAGGWGIGISGYQAIAVKNNIVSGWGTVGSGNTYAGIFMYKDGANPGKNQKIHISGNTVTGGAGQPNATIGIASSGYDDIVVSNNLIDGTTVGSAFGAGVGIFSDVASASIHVTGNRVANTAKDGILLTNSGTSKMSVTNNVVENYGLVGAAANTAFGVLLQELSGTCVGVIANTSVTGGAGRPNGTSGVGSLCDNTTISAVTVDGATYNGSSGTSGFGVYLTSVTAASITGGSFLNADSNGVYLDGGVVNWIVSGVTVKNNGKSVAAPNRAGILFGPGAGNRYGIVSGNAIYDDQGSPTQQYGISMPTGATTRVSVFGNVIYGNVVADINGDILTSPSPVFANVFSTTGHNVGSSQVTGWKLGPTPYSILNLIAEDATAMICTDCKVTSVGDNTCTSGGTGALAVRLNGVWRCFANQN